MEEVEIGYERLKRNAATLLRELEALQVTYRDEAARLGKRADSEAGLELDAEEFGRLWGRKHALDDIDHSLAVILGRYGYGKLTREEV